MVLHGRPRQQNAPLAGQSIQRSIGQRRIILEPMGLITNEQVARMIASHSFRMDAEGLVRDDEDLRV